MDYIWYFRDLSKNHLAALEGLTFQGLENLQVLKLRKNAINVLSAGSFYGLNNIQSL